MISHHQKTRLTYEELDRTSNALARGLARRGVKKGDRVGVMLGNGTEFATVTYALFKLGAVLVPLNPGFNPAQVAAALAHLTAEHFVLGAETNLPHKDPRSNEPLLTHLVPNVRGGSRPESVAVPSLRDVVLVDNSGGRVDVGALRTAATYEDVLADGGDGAVPLEEQGLRPDEVVNIQFTSGTTSMPKAACLSHRSILNNGKSIGDRMLLTEEDVVCCPPPLFQ